MGTEESKGGESGGEEERGSDVERSVREKKRRKKSHQVRPEGGGALGRTTCDTKVLFTVRSCRHKMSKSWFRCTTKLGFAWKTTLNWIMMTDNIAF